MSLAVYIIENIYVKKTNNFIIYFTLIVNFSEGFVKGEPEGEGDDTGYPPPDPGEGDDPNAGLTQDDMDPNTQVLYMVFAVLRS